MLRRLSSRSAFRVAVAALALGAGLMVAADLAEARVGRSGSFGSRGSRTWAAPAPTPTAPTAQPMQRSATPNAPSYGQTAPGLGAGAATAARPGGFFNRGGLMGGIMGGLLGAGLFGMLMGGGFFSGLGSLAGMLGFILQVVLIVVAIRFVMGWLRNRNQPSYAGGARPDAMAREGYQPPRPTPAGLGASGDTAGAADRAGFNTGPRGRPLKLAGSDFDAFESRLTQVQEAYGRDDRQTLDRLLTPEMARYIGEELDDMERQGLENHLSDVKLLQGDLSEAWSENGHDYATVAMRYQLRDTMVQRSSGRVVEGDPETLLQAIEFWTFTRPSGGGEWVVSAIQQA
ncbi:TIM44-like domain-containing protein [Ancylobacter sp. 6x-1]|uniref:TIM44-like domain-containing protein n=1 Tax=Ancylobacter crimeensis TaxID=2579147 RepID=A0ABT0D9S3_9HYPH|nr:TIM44-like domain-containing protein [Ancylobacter crimeensis]MCK0196709.1 TIM44-like domain-containing protein [Ancylobacter crimeensis]